MAVVEQYTTSARVLLQDITPPYRYADIEMINELNLGISEAKRLRPDLFLTYRDKNPYPTFASLADEVPFEDMYMPALIYYIVGKCTLRDEEDTDDKRGIGMVQKFTAQLISLPG